MLALLPHELSDWASRGSGVRPPTCEHARLHAGLHGLKVVVVTAAASVFEELAASRVHVEEVAFLDGLAGSRVVPHGAQLVEDPQLRRLFSWRRETELGLTDATDEDDETPEGDSELKWDFEKLLWLLTAAFSSGASF